MKDTGQDVSSQMDVMVDGSPEPTEDVSSADGLSADSLTDTSVLDSTRDQDLSIPDDTHSVSDTLMDSGSLSDTAPELDIIEDVAPSMDTAPDAPVEVCETFASSIQPLLDVDCVICHKGPNGSLGLFLTADVAIEELVNIPSTHDNNLLLVTPFEPENSFFVEKLKDSPSHGNKMPLGKPAWTPAVVQLISDWIAAGATQEPFNCITTDQ